MGFNLVGFAMTVFFLFVVGFTDPNYEGKLIENLVLVFIPLLFGIWAGRFVD